MNRFYLKPNPKPEFKVAQPLPAFLGVLTTESVAASRVEAILLNLGQERQPDLEVVARTESFAIGGSNLAS